MFRDRLRCAFRALTAVAFLTTPTVSVPGLDHDAGPSCEHQQTQPPDDHHQSADSDCEHSDACQECVTPSCHTTSHCGASSTGIPAPEPGVALAALGGPVPTAAASQLSSITTGPPTPPPLLSR